MAHFCLVFQELNSANIDDYLNKHQAQSEDLSCSLNKNKSLIQAYAGIKPLRSTPIYERKQHLANYLRVAHIKLNVLELKEVPQLNLQSTTEELELCNLLKRLVYENSQSKLTTEELEHCKAGFLTRLAILQSAKEHDPSAFSLLTKTPRTLTHDWGN